MKKKDRYLSSGKYAKIKNKKALKIASAAIIAHADSLDSPALRKCSTPHELERETRRHLREHG